MISEDEILEHLIKAYGGDEQPKDLEVHWNENMKMEANKQNEKPQENVHQLWQNALKLYFE